MILSLRQRHRRVFYAMGIFLPVAFVFGVASRQPVPLAKELPATFAVRNTTSSVVWERKDLFGKAPVSVQLLQAAGKADADSIRLITDKNFVKPDVLVYWSSGNPAIGDSLPTNAVLLGPLEASELRENEPLTKSPGMLILFSLADGEIVDVSKEIQFNNLTK
jgi:hypothetical protein